MNWNALIFGMTLAGALPAGRAAAQMPSQDPVNQDFQKGQQVLVKTSALIAVFQPFLLKAQELYGQGKAIAQMGQGTGTGAAPAYPGSTPAYPSSGTPAGTAPTYPSSGLSSGTPTGGAAPAYPGSGGAAPSYPVGAQPAYPASPTAPTAQPSPELYLPVNNPGAVNNDGSGNWGNQNNGLYGNCLDVLTGTVMGMGEAADKPSSVDLLFFAPADGQNTYYIMTPGYARDNNSTATYMTQHTSDQVLQWKDVNESEVALTRLTIGQFDQIKNNGQITGAVRNAQNYAGYYASVGNRLEGQVFAVRVQMDSRQVFALVAIDRQLGTSGSNGYLKIRIKAQGLDGNNNGIPDANFYIR